MLQKPRRWRTPLAALLLGALTPLAFAPTGWWWLLPLTLAPLLWRALLRPCSARAAARLGWLWGFGSFMAGIGWIQVSLSVYGELPWLLGWLAVALLAAFLALFPAAAMWLAARGSACGVVRLLGLAPAAWLLGEWVRGWIFTGFPWLSLGDSQAPDGWLAPLAPVVGQVAKQVAASTAQWVVLPETAVPFFLQQMPGEVLGALHEPVRQRGAELLIGLPTLDGERYYNSVVALGNTTAIPYSKHHLVPFGEFVPWGFRWFVDAVSIPLADFSRGVPDQAPFALGGQRIAFMICYEDIFASEVAARARDATLLVNQTNDAWFGQTAAPWQHAQQSQMRALENARPLLRATNNGVTLAADHRGQVIAALPPFAPGVLAVEVQGRNGTTPYQRWRDWPVVIFALLALLAVELRRRRV